MTDTVSNRVHEFRVRANITQEALAAAIGVTRQTIIAMEKGNYVPSVRLALRVAKFFNTRVDDIFFV